MTRQELRDAVSRHIEEYRDAYNETGDERYRAVKEELLHVLGLIDAVDGKPVGKDKMTLKELARELRKLFEFKYLTCDGCGDQRDYCIWLDKPEYTRDGWIVYTISSVVNSLLLFESYKLAIQLDLSEYKDADGNIDYSKCIVEVE